MKQTITRSREVEQIMTLYKKYFSFRKIGLALGRSHEYVRKIVLTEIFNEKRNK